MTAVGVMEMPADFRYRDVFLKGKPRHEGFDYFLARHPKMEQGKRAKIFSPFDALKGFSEAVSAKDVLYREKILLSQENSEELSRRLQILRNLTCSSRIARKNKVQVTVTWYEPCYDVDHEDYGIRGRYRKTSGICYNVDPEISKMILIDQTRILIDDILNIEAPGDLFQKDWAEEPSLEWGV